MSRERYRELAFISVSHARTVKAPAVGTRSGRFPRCSEVWEETLKPSKKLIYPLCGSQEQQNDLCILFAAGGAVNKEEVALGGAEQGEGEFQDPSPRFPARDGPVSRCVPPRRCTAAGTRPGRRRGSGSARRALCTPGTAPAPRRWTPPGGPISSGAWTRSSAS